MIIPPPCLCIGAGEIMTSAASPSDCWKKNSPTVPPFARRPSQTRAPFTILALCSQKIGFLSSCDHHPFATMPCSAGESPVLSDACATHVTAGKTDSHGSNLSPATSVIALRSRSR